MNEFYPDTKYAKYEKFTHNIFIRIIYDKERMK